MRKRILVIGGGKWQVPIIQKAKELGCYVICSNLYKNSIGFQYVDESYVVDVLNKEDNLQLAKQCKIDAVITDQSDIAVNTVAFIAEQLDLAGVGIDIADLYTNKFRMREELRIEGLYHPKYKVCTTINEAMEFFKILNATAIIKPLANQSSRGIYKIMSISDLEQNFVNAMEYSINNCILIEEFIGGIELTVEGIKIGNKHYSLAVSQKEHYRELPTVAKSLIYLQEFNHFDIEKLKVINDNLFTALSFGLTHVEYKYYNNKFYLIEAAIRGGGTKISSHIVPIVSSVDANALYIKMALGEEVAEVNQNSVNSAILKFFDFSNGRVSKINGLDYIEKNKNIIDFDFEFKEGDIVYSPSDDRSRVGYYIAFAENDEKLNKIVRDIQKKVHLDYV